MSSLRLAVVGCGHLGRIHARKLASRSDVDLKFVVDPCEETRSQLASETGACPHANLNEIEEPLDAAIVAAPTHLHLPLTAQLLQRGCHVLVEKPLAPTAHEAATLCQEARRNRRLLQVGHVERFNPALLAVEDEITEPKYIECRRTSGFSFRSVDIGAVLDLMIHDIDIVLQLANSEVVEVSAFGLATLGRREDVAQTRLQFANGCVADLFASRISQRRMRTMNVLGEHYLAQLDFAEHRACVQKSGSCLAERAFDAEQFAPAERLAMGPNYYESLFETSELETQPCDAIEAEQGNFIAAIDGQQRLRVDGDAGYRAVEVAERILNAINAHQWDGRPQGRVGPLFEYPASIIRPLEWSADQDAQPQRRAG
ncbi:MAG: Gfo/Idh/MocA family oxidoreductase [Planctomycetota bacterium]